MIKETIIKSWIVLRQGDNALPLKAKKIIPSEVAGVNNFFPAPAAGSQTGAYRPLDLQGLHFHAGQASRDHGRILPPSKITAVLATDESPGSCVAMMIAIPLSPSPVTR